MDLFAKASPRKVTEPSELNLLLNLSPNAEAGDPTADASVVVYSSIALRTWVSTPVKFVVGTSSRSNKEHRAICH